MKYWFIRSPFKTRKWEDILMSGVFNLYGIRNYSAKNNIAKIKKGITKELRLGNLDAKRDWGHSKDYVKAMWMMLQQEKPDDYVICSEETHSIKEFCDIAFSLVDLDYRDYVVIDPTFYRPAEVDLLLGNASKAKKKLGWERTISFKELIEEMVSYDMGNC